MNGKWWILLLLAVAPPVRAQVEPIPMPGDTRLVTFAWDPNNTYNVLTRPRSVTHIELGVDEKVTTFALGDTVQWLAEHADNNVFLKPRAENLYTNAVLVTSKKRIYHLVLRSSPESGKWYQRVSWTYPNVIVYQEAADERPKRDDIATLADAVDPSKLNFSYSIKGDAPFRPLTVFDDGKFTWIQLPPNTQDLPALFLRAADGEGLELANYSLRGNYMVLQRLASGVVLKLGKAEVEIAVPRKSTWFWQK